MKKSYEVPLWSSKPSIEYHLEVVKNGEVIDTLSLPMDMDYVVFGRNEDFASKGFVLDHASISRQHAVIQHRGQNGGRLYIYDLGSVHHTYWNQRQIRPFVYVPLRVGDVLRFGESSRLYVLGSQDPRAYELLDLQNTIQEVATKEAQGRLLIKKKMLAENEASRKKGVLDSVSGGRGDKTNTTNSIAQQGGVSGIIDGGDIDLEDDEEGDDSEEEKEEEDEDEKEYHESRKRLRIEAELGNEAQLFDEEDEFFDRTTASSTAPAIIEHSPKQYKRKRKNLLVLYDDVHGEEKGKEDLETYESLQKEEQIVVQEIQTILQSLESPTMRSPSNQPLSEGGDSLDAYMSAMQSEEQEKSRQALKKSLEGFQSKLEYIRECLQFLKPSEASVSSSLIHLAPEKVEHRLDKKSSSSSSTTTTASVILEDDVLKADLISENMFES